MKAKPIPKKIDEKLELIKERNWVLLIAAIAAILASIPYIWGAFLAPAGTHFTGLTHNIDDGAVYLSWIRQIADGSFTFHNLYAPAAGQGGQFNILILIMGLIVKLTMLPTVWVFHGFRIALSIMLVWAAWVFLFNFLGNRAERKLCVLLIAFSSGIGWLLGSVKAVTGSVDLWQPEAITFLSMYLNPLFLTGLVLMIGSFHYLLLAEKTGQLKYGLWAGACLLALANIHTYDVITVGCVWLAWFIISSIIRKSLNTRTLLLSLMAAAMALPALAYQYFLYSTDTVFQARANTVIASPSILSYLMGFGVVFVGALIGIYAISRQWAVFSKVPARVFPIVWAVVGFFVAYIPVAQQRKLIMGVHIPLCILCALGLSWVIGKLPRKFQLETLVILVVLMVQSNVTFLKNDIILLSGLKTVTIFPAYITDSQLKAIEYIRDNTTSEDTVFASPAVSLFIPAIAGKRVYYGHWSETPNYADGLMKWRQFTDKTFVMDARRALWLSTKAAYYVSESDDTRPPAKMLLNEAKQVYQDGDVRVYKLNEPIIP